MMDLSDGLAADAARLAATLGLLEQLGVVSRPDDTIIPAGEAESEAS
jgi:thiamine monophosphate kinase